MKEDDKKRAPNTLKETVEPQPLNKNGHHKNSSDLNISTRANNSQSNHSKVIQPISEISKKQQKYTSEGKRRCPSPEEIGTNWKSHHSTQIGKHRVGKSSSPPKASINLSINNNVNSVCFAPVYISNSPIPHIQQYIPPDKPATKGSPVPKQTSKQAFVIGNRGEYTQKRTNSPNGSSQTSSPRAETAQPEGNPRVTPRGPTESKGESPRVAIKQDSGKKNLIQVGGKSTAGGNTGGNHHVHSNSVMNTPVPKAVPTVTTNQHSSQSILHRRLASVDSQPPYVPPQGSRYVKREINHGADPNDSLNVSNKSAYNK